MIFLDRREPEDLVKAIRYYGVETSYPVHLDFGDLFFEGNGERGPGAMVALERKKLGDLVNSMKDRRLAGHQLRGLWKTYDYAFLIVEGMWRCGTQGEIEHWTWKREMVKGVWIKRQGWAPYFGKADGHSITYRHVASFLHSLTLRSRSPHGEPMRILRCSTIEETAAQVASLYKNFTEKEWREHSAHDQIYTGQPAKQHGGEWAREHGHDMEARGKYELENPNTCWRMASQLPGVDRKAQGVAKYFATMENAVLAGLDPQLRKKVDRWFIENPKAAVSAWQAALGVKVGGGKAKAEAVIRALREKGA